MFQFSDILDEDRITLFEFRSRIYIIIILKQNYIFTGTLGFLLYINTIGIKYLPIVNYFLIKYSFLP